MSRLTLLVPSAFSSRLTRTPQSRPRNARRPRVEGLEARQLLTTTLASSIGALILHSSTGAITNPVEGEDGNFWFTENQGRARAANTVVQITRSQQLTELPLPAGDFLTGELTDVGFGLWAPGYTVTSTGVSRAIFEISTDISNGLNVTAYPVPSAGNTTVSSTLTAADNSVWFLADTVDASGSHTVTVDEMATEYVYDPMQPSGIGLFPGEVTAYPAPDANGQESLTLDPNGTLWISGGGELATLKPDGTVTPVPLPDNGVSLSATPDWTGGALWVRYQGASTGVGLARVATDGSNTVTTIPLSNVTTLTEGDYGNIWFTQSAPTSGVTTIGSITTDGTNKVTTLSTAVFGQIKDPGIVGSGGNLYYIKQSTSTQWPAIVEVAQDGSGTVTEIPLTIGAIAPPTLSAPDPIHGLMTSGDGSLWFVNESDETFDQVYLSLQLVPVTPTPGPTVESIARTGVGAESTELTVTFDEGLNAAQASDVKNYALVLTGPFGKSRPHAKGIAIKLAVYDAATNTVTLTPAHRLPLHAFVKLTINGASPTGVSGVTGAKLGAPSVGTPGSNFATLIHKFGPVAPKAAPAHHSVKHGHAK